MTGSHSTKLPERRTDEDYRNQQTNTRTRYATILLKIDDEISPEGTSVSREYLHHFNLVDDGTIVMLHHFRGELDQINEELDTASEVLNYDIVGQGDGEGFAYVHCELTDPVRSIVSTLHKFEVILDTPLEFCDGGFVKATLIGEEPSLRQSLEALSDIVEIRLQKTGEYHPGIQDLGATLTNRQHQMLTVAVELGYYEVPRQATLEDIAAKVDRSRATVGEHLQKIESKVLSRLV
ncbi:helix-turn-helix domain-containing protein [Haladaptatus halobius]|uniref:helix-turn-helix domain-containing protein n=1 Tax=Haladaptatus halobius TaxID=2884875 RepID=UPI001D0BA5B0|nr:helix-turn-helix domain-containing protein [Haladaptatus halobius]